MKIAPLFLLLFLVSCNDVSLKKVNPMEKVVDAISDATLDPTAGFVDEYMRLLDEHRTSLALPSFTRSEVIEKAAAQYSAAMANGMIDFGHSNLKERCAGLIAAIGGGGLCGEIIATGQKTPQEVFDAWLVSTDHQQKIESIRYTHTGLGIARDSNGKIFWTQIFIEVI